jgi:dTDP-4-amino-4,6-dideoxygalactose transaminase
MKKKIPFYRAYFDDRELSNLRRVLKSGWLTTGKETRAFELEFARYAGCGYALGVNSCTAALHLSLLALGMGKGDVIITSPFTFASTANVIIHTGAEVRFVDIVDDDFTMDLDLLEKAVRGRVRAVIPVHFAGAVCDMDRLEAIRKKYGIKVVQDAAHSVEAKWKGKHISSYGDTTCFSFYATKNITTGEGGMLTTSDRRVADRARILSLHGLSRDAWTRYENTKNILYRILYPGFKYNMFDIQAAIGRSQLKKIGGFRAKRKTLDSLYRKLLGDVEGIRFQKLKKEVFHSHHLFVVDLNTKKSGIRRDVLMDAFRRESIGFSVHFVSLHMQPYYKNRYHFKENDFPVAARLSKDIISLPFYPEMTPADVSRVVSCFKKSYRKR